MYRDGPASRDGQIEPQMVRVDRRRLGAPDREHGVLQPAQAAASAAREKTATVSSAATDATRRSDSST